MPNFLDTLKMSGLTVVNVDGSIPAARLPETAYAETIGDNSTTEFTITHNLGTRDIIVMVHEVSTPYDVIYVNTSVATIDTIVLTFITAPTSNQFRVVVMSMGSPGNKYVVPPSDDWSWDNQGTATITHTGKALLLKQPASGTETASDHVYYRDAPSAPWTLTAAVSLAAVGINYSNGGIVIRENSSGKLIALRLLYNSGWQITLLNATSSTNETSNSLTVAAPIHCGEIWLRISDDTTNRKYFMSTDNINWIQLFSEGRTTFLTADQLGILIDSRNATYPVALSVTSWEVT